MKFSRFAWGIPFDTRIIYYTRSFSLSSMVLIGFCVGAFMVLGHLLALQKIKKIDIVEELKSKE